MSYLAESVSNKETVEAIEELTWSFVDDGIMTRKQLSKRVIELSGCWLFVVYLYQDYTASKGAYTDPKIALVRYRKYAKGYKRMSHFNLSLPQLIDSASVLSYWMKHGMDIANEMDIPDLPADDAAMAPVPL